MIMFFYRGINFAVVYRYYINIISYTVNKIERCPILSESFTICNIVCLGLGICMEITHISNFIPTKYVGMMSE